MTEYEHGQQDLAREIYDIIVNNPENWICFIAVTDREIAHYLDKMAMRIFNKVKPLIGEYYERIESKN